MVTHGGRREGAGRKKSGKVRTKNKHFFLSDDEIKKVNKALRKIKKEYNYKYDVDAFLHLINNYIEMENNNEE